MFAFDPKRASTRKYDDMGYRANWWRSFVALLLLAAAACGKIETGDGAKAPGQETDAAVEAGGPEIESLPASVADHTFKSYYAWRYYAPNGTFEDSDVYGTTTTGRWWTKDGEVCAQFDSGGARPLCSRPDYSRLTPGRQKSVAADESTGPEIESLPASVADHTFKSYYAWRYYAPDGTFENGDGYTITTGRWWMKDGEVCAQFNSGGAQPLCSKPDYARLTPGRNPG
jgi:hypothetical protein